MEAQRFNLVLGFTSKVKQNPWLLSASTTLFGILPMQNRMCDCSAHQPRFLVYFKCKTGCLAAQRINHAFWYTSNVKPGAWLLCKRTHHSTSFESDES
jgi:hypothetical protein